MTGLKTYVLESYDELRNKVSWPSWNELQSSSIVVLVATFIISLIIYAMDLSFGQAMDFLYEKIFR